MFRRFVLGLLMLGWLSANRPFAAEPTSTGLRLATFDIDATPPVGSHMAYDPVTNKWDLGLRARGVVLLGTGDPIVLCGWKYRRRQIQRRLAHQPANAGRAPRRWQAPRVGEHKARTAHVRHGALGG